MSVSNYFEEEEFSTKFNGKTVLRTLSQLKPHWRWVAGFLSFIGMVSFFEALFTYIGKVLVDSAITPKDPVVLKNILVFNGGVAIIQTLCVFSFIYLAGVLGNRVEYDLRKTMFNHLQRLSFSYFDRTPIGWIMARVTSDAERIADLITWGLLDMTWASMNLVTSIIFMVTINWQLALMILFLFPVLVVIATWFRSRILAEYRNARKLNSKITGSYNENITGVRVVKALVREQENLNEFDVLTTKMYNASYKAAWLSALFMPVVQIISAIAIGVVVWYGGSKVGFGGMTIGGVQAFIGYITFMMWPVLDISRVFAEMQHSIASSERIFSLIDAVPEVVDKPNAVEVPSIRGDIEFDHVDFYYEADKPVLQDFSLTIKSGETIALVGPTGSGKSTIVNLLCRFYEPKAGTIRIAGRDYTDMTMHSIQSHIGMVLQTPRLFSGTIRDNIRYGQLTATDEEIEDAAKLVGADEFIKTLKKGYDEEIGEGGNLLSVGQKQLISLARAVLAKPELFIMDEATSSVDTLTEALIQRGMETLMKGRTSFVIAHRLSTIKRADRIIVVQDGKIEEMGTHAELLRARGHYYRLYTRQFRHEMEVEYDPFADKPGVLETESLAV